jgi:hypothetical protein
MRGHPRRLHVATTTCHLRQLLRALLNDQKEIAMKRLMAFAVAALATIISGAAQAGAHWSIGIEIAPPILYNQVPVYVPAPVYAPAPVYYEPRLIYEAPRPAYQRAPAYYESPRFYQGPTVIYGPPVYERRGWRARRHEHEHGWDEDR